MEYTNVIIEQADRLRNLVDRSLGLHPGMHVTESIHKVAERVVKLVSMELPDNVKLVRDYDPEPAGTSSMTRTRSNRFLRMSYVTAAGAGARRWRDHPTYPEPPFS